MPIALEMVKKMSKNKVLRMKSCIVENVPTPCGIIFKLCTASQLPYRAKSKNRTKKYENSGFPRISPIRPRWSYSLLARCAAPRRWCRTLRLYKPFIWGAAAHELRAIPFLSKDFISSFNPQLLGHALGLVCLCPIPVQIPYF